LFAFSLFATPRPPPTPTLFPYTTLFRSRSCDLVMARVPAPGPAARRVDGGRPGLSARNPRRGNGSIEIAGGHVRGPCLPGANLLDRKSTRLNSSHSQISYAVFCLKKKKQ